MGSVLLPFAMARPAVAADEGFSAVTNKTATMGDGVAVTDLQIIGTGNDQLNLSLNAPSGDFTFGTEVATVTGGNNSVALSGTRSDINATLATLTYTPSTIGPVTITASLGSNVSGDVIIDPIGGHAYIIVSNQQLGWNDAAVAAAQLEYGGVQGYLANITSDTEDEFIVDNLTGNGWIGASDVANEGDWKWMGGPEAGTSFWSGGPASGGGQPVGGAYSNWNPSEPNNAGGEDCAEYIVGQGWNDLPCTGITRSYVVEFGSASSLPDPITTQFTVTTSATTRNIANCQQLLALNTSHVYDTINLTADIDCAGYDVEPLLDSEIFRGTLEGNGHTIRNVTIEDQWESQIGLFSQAEGATFQDVTLDNFTITGEESVGALVGYARNITVSDVRVTNVTINSDWGYSGGLVGELRNYTDETTHILRSSVDGGTVQSDEGYSMGGLIGYTRADDGGTLLIEVVYTNVNLANGSGEYAGGLIGRVRMEVWDAPLATTITIRDAYTWGDVVSDGQHAGGLVGRMDIDTNYQDAEYDQVSATITIQRAYARGAVTGQDSVGGLVGQLDQTYTAGAAYTVEDAFAMGAISALNQNPDYLGALIGQGYTDIGSGLSVSGLYYDQTRTGLNTAGPITGLDGVAVAVNTSGDQPHYFINNNTNAPMNTWDFNNIWVTNANIPPTFRATQSEGGDSDGDSIPDEVENAGPNGGDANGDGIPDSQQANVASFVNSSTGHYVAVAVDEACALTQAFVSTEASMSVQDAGYDYPASLLNFTVDCGVPGYTTPVSLYYYGINSDGLVVRKHNPGTHAFFTIPSVGLSQRSIGGQNVAVAAYQITDGGELDIDGTANGTIVDPVGLASLVVGAPNTGLGGRR